MWVCVCHSNVVQLQKQPTPADCCSLPNVFVKKYYLYFKKFFLDKWGCCLFMYLFSFDEWQPKKGFFSCSTAHWFFSMLDFFWHFKLKLSNLLNAAELKYLFSTCFAPHMPDFSRNFLYHAIVKCLCIYIPLSLFNTLANIFQLVQFCLDICYLDWVTVGTGQKRYQEMQRTVSLTRLHMGFKVM